MRTRHALVLSLLLLTPTLGPLQASATELSGFGTISITQIPVEGLSVVGTWYLIKPDNMTETGTEKSRTFTESTAGNYLLSIDPPSGMGVSITKTVGATVSHTLTPQLSFLLAPSETNEIIIRYTLIKPGIVSVQSEPAGLPFTLTGPDGAVKRGVTPAGFQPMPVGLYSLQYEAIQGCTTPKPQSARLINDSRINFTMSVSCDSTFIKDQRREEQSAIDHVSTVIRGEQVVFKDVPSRMWFAPFVQEVLKSEIMTGYQNEAGKFTGVFGTADAVTMAQLAKIAHVLANISLAPESPAPINEQARETWAAPFFASAERRGWIVYTDPTIDPTRPATRGEVVTTLLQALKVPVAWPNGQLFSDISVLTPYAGAIETAGKQGLITGDEPSKNFRPLDQINRAEMAKIITQAMKLYVGKTTITTTN